MAEETSNRQREFHCSHCNGAIYIPADLPPTTAPCPHCGQSVTSPAPLPAAPVQDDFEPVQRIVAEVRLPLAPAPTPFRLVEPSAVADATLEAPQPEQEHDGALEIVVPSESLPVIASAVPVDDDSPPLPVERRRRRSSRTKEIEAEPQESSSASSSLLVPILVMLALLLLVGGGILYLNKGRSFQPQAIVTDQVQQERIKEADFIKGGWVNDAREVLNSFVTASTPEKKARYVLGGDALLPEMRAFYADHPVEDSGTPASAFGAMPLADIDSRRGLFLMTFEQPPQIEMKARFVPLSTLELQNGLEDPDLLLSSAASASNFLTGPIQIQAFFKRVPGQGLKLDWHTFVQTKYRLLRDFTDVPAAGKSAVFRVLIQEDVPERGRYVDGMRTYKIFDPINNDDTVRVNVGVDSDLGRTLSKINWIGIRKTRVDAFSTATVRLAWTEDPTTPELVLKDFICWEFEGLGGDAEAAGK